MFWALVIFFVVAVEAQELENMFDSDLSTGKLFDEAQVLLKQRGVALDSDAAEWAVKREEEKMAKTEPTKKGTKKASTKCALTLKNRHYSPKRQLRIKKAFQNLNPGLIGLAKLLKLKVDPELSPIGRIQMLIAKLDPSQKPQDIGASFNKISVESPEVKKLLQERGASKLLAAWKELKDILGDECKKHPWLCNVRKDDILMCDWPKVEAWYVVALLSCMVVHHSPSKNRQDCLKQRDGWIRDDKKAGEEFGKQFKEVVALQHQLEIPANYESCHCDGCVKKNCKCPQNDPKEKNPKKKEEAKECEDLCRQTSCKAKCPSDATSCKYINQAQTRFLPRWCFGRETSGSKDWREDKPAEWPFPDFDTNTKARRTWRYPRYNVLRDKPAQPNDNSTGIVNNSLRRQIWFDTCLRGINSIMRESTSEEVALARSVQRVSSDICAPLMI